VTFNILTLISYNFLLTIYNLNFLNLFIFIIRQIFQKSFFSEKNPNKKQKALQCDAKGLELASSPDCNIDRTFTSTFYFPQKVTNPNKIKRLYRNPIYLAKEYKEIINSGEVKNQAEVARKLLISRARITQILRLLKLDSLIFQELEKLGDPLKSKIITERMLRPYVNKPFKKQIKILDIL